MTLLKDKYNSIEKHTHSIIDDYQLQNVTFFGNKYLQLPRRPIIGSNGDVNQKYMKAIYDIAYVTIIVITMSWKFIFKNKYIIISWRYCSATVAASTEI